MQIYKVRYSLTDERRYRHGNEVIISEDIVDAIETTKLYHPNAHIWTAAHHGRVNRISSKILSKLITEAGS